MRRNLENLAEGLIKLKSEYAGSFYTMSIEYLRLLESVRALLESKKKKHKTQARKRSVRQLAECIKVY